jgi:hypothetical protein
MQSTKIQIQYGEINIMFEGSESFVKDQIKNLKSILEILNNPIIEIKDIKTVKTKVENNVIKNNSESGQIFDKYPTIFAEDGEIIQIILPKLPGKSDKEKSENLVLLYSLANEGKFVDKKIPYKNLVDQRKHHGIVDKGGNFSSYVKGLKGNILFNGKGNDATVKLTVPGKETAEKLCEEIIKENEQQ